MLLLFSLEPTVADLANFDIIKKVKSVWWKLGTHLGQSQSDLVNFSQRPQMDDYACCTSVFEHWIRNDGSDYYPLSWQSVCSVLCAVDHRGTAGELKLALAAKGVFVYL